jgi:thermolysin
VCLAIYSKILLSVEGIVKHQSCIKKIILLVILFGVFFGLTSVGYAEEPPSDKSDTYKKLVNEAESEPEITWDEETGVPTFIRGAFPVSENALQGMTVDAEEQAYTFFNQYGGLFQMKNPVTELSLMRDSVEKDGGTHMRFQQMYQNVPVWGGQMLVHSRNGQLTAVNGHYQPEINVNPIPAITAAEAEIVARTELGDHEASLEQEVELVIDTYYVEPTLTWLVKLKSKNPLGRWFYFVNAHTGEVTDYYNALTYVKNRYIYDSYGNCYDDWGTQIANETTGGSLPVGSAGRKAFNNMGYTYDYFSNIFGRDSYTGGGSAIRSHVNYGTYSSCYSAAWNAYWDGSEFVFGSGGGGVNNFAGAHDVVAHEFTHAVTQYTGDMIYRFQQGALNEAMSDIFGVFAEQYATSNSSDWILGEDLGNPEFYRSLSNPPLYGLPDHMSVYNQLGMEYDNGGVHINMGIPSKAAYLMTVGGTFHGTAVTGFGRTRVEQIFYRALYYYLSPLSGFNDIKDSTIQACNDLIGSYGITAANCTEVRDAWIAVGLASPSITTPPSYPNKVYLPLIIKTSAGMTYEPNDDESQAYGPLASGTSYYAYIQSSGDVDIYYFTTSGGNTSVTLSSLPAGTDYDLVLYDQNGIPEAQSENSGTTSESISTYLFAGTYYIYVYPWYTASSATDSYRLVVSYP